jgi:hypothetical protein
MLRHPLPGAGSSQTGEWRWNCQHAAVKLGKWRFAMPEARMAANILTVASAKAGCGEDHAHHGARGNAGGGGVWVADADSNRTYPSGEDAHLDMRAEADETRLADAIADIVLVDTARPGNRAARRPAPPPMLFLWPARQPGRHRTGGEDPAAHSEGVSACGAQAGIAFSQLSGLASPDQGGPS